MGTSCISAGVEAAGRESVFSNGQFPTGPAPDWSRVPLLSNPVTSQGASFDVGKLSTAKGRLPAGKSPGSDSVINEILSAVVRCNPSLLLKALNDCLRFRTFPEAWKRAKVLFHHKGTSKPVDQPSSFKPISFLGGAEKILEKLILMRISNMVQVGLFPNQYGFRTGRGTVEVIDTV